jgi:6-phosphofructokinase
MNVGAPAPGMNGSVRTIVRLAISRSHSVFAIRDGFPGLQS